MCVLCVYITKFEHCGRCYCFLLTVCCCSVAAVSTIASAVTHRHIFTLEFVVAVYVFKNFIMVCLLFSHHSLSSFFFFYIHAKKYTYAYTYTLPSAYTIHMYKAIHPPLFLRSLSSNYNTFACMYGCACVCMRVCIRVRCVVQAFDLKNIGI